MADRLRRPPGAYLWDGPLVMVPGWVADWIVRQTNFDARRVELRGVDPYVDDVLVALRTAALTWVSATEAVSQVVPASSGSGTSLEANPQPARLSTSDVAAEDGLLGVGAAAALVGVSGEAVRRACRERRLPAQLIDGRWLIARADAERYRAARAA